MTYKPFPAITVYQPWASLIAYGFKEFETRHWQPPQKYIGELIAIHAGKQWGDREQRWFAWPVLSARWKLEREKAHCKYHSALGVRVSLLL